MPMPEMNEPNPFIAGGAMDMGSFGVSLSLEDSPALMGGVGGSASTSGASPMRRPLNTMKRKPMNRSIIDSSSDDNGLKARV